MRLEKKHFISIAAFAVFVIGFWLLGHFNANSGAGIAGLFQIFQRNFTCTDSDGGLDYYTPGKVTQTYQYFWVSEKKYTRVYSDKCAGDKNLLEYYCRENKVRPERYPCPNGCENGACVQQKNIGIIYVYDGNDTYNPKWRENISLLFPKTSDAINKILGSKIKYNFNILGEIKTTEFCWNPAILNLTYIGSRTKTDRVSGDIIEKGLFTTTSPLPGSDFGNRTYVFDSFQKLSIEEGKEYLITIKLENVNLDCPKCRTYTTDRTEEFQRLFPDENFLEVHTTYWELNCENNLFDNKFDQNKINTLKQRAANELKFNLDNFDEIFIIFGHLGTILANESSANLKYRCTTGVGFIGGYGNFIFAENGLLQGGLIDCSEFNPGSFYEKIGWHFIVHEILHSYGAVDVYQTGTVFGVPSYRDEALKVDPLTDESVMGDSIRFSCMENGGMEKDGKVCSREELERVYLDEYNRILIDKYLTTY